MSNTIEKELKKDHKKIKSLLKDLEYAVENNTVDREEIFRALDQELKAHSKAEEKTYYSKLYNNEKTKDLANEGKEEHRLCDNLLNEMEKMDINSDAWKAKFTVLKELVEHHVEEEEQELFKKSDKVLNHEQQEKMCEEFLEKKEEIILM